MQAVLTFYIPEEQTEHLLAVKGPSYHTVIRRLDAELRGRLTDATVPLHPVRREECQFILDELYRLMGEEEVSFVDS